MAFVALGFERCSSAEHIRPLCLLAERELARLDSNAGELLAAEGSLRDALMGIVSGVRRMLGRVQMRSSMSLQLAGCVICPIARIALKMRRGAGRIMQAQWFQLLGVASHVMETVLSMEREAGGWADVLRRIDTVLLIYFENTC
jgi:hypothetical protein